VRKAPCGWRHRPRPARRGQVQTSREILDRDVADELVVARAGGKSNRSPPPAQAFACKAAANVTDCMLGMMPTS